MTALTFLSILLVSAGALVWLACAVAPLAAEQCQDVRIVIVDDGDGP